MDKSRSRAERKEDDDLAIPTVLAVLVMCTVPLLLLDAGLRFFSGIDAVTTLVDDGPGMIARAGARSIWWGVAEVGAAVAVLRGSRRAWFFGMSVAGVTVASQLALPSLIGAPLANAFRPPWWPAYVAGHAFIVVVLLAAFLSEGVIRTRARLSRT